jgi:hypothetical protein
MDEFPKRKAQSAAASRFVGKRSKALSAVALSMPVASMRSNAARPRCGAASGESSTATTTTTASAAWLASLEAKVLRTTASKCPTPDSAHSVYNMQQGTVELEA